MYTYRYFWSCRHWLVHSLYSKISTTNDNNYYCICFFNTKWFRFISPSGYLVNWVVITLADLNIRFYRCMWFFLWNDKIHVSRMYTYRYFWSCRHWLVHKAFYDLVESLNINCRDCNITNHGHMNYLDKPQTYTQRKNHIHLINTSLVRVCVKLVVQKSYLFCLLWLV
jgi:hypothetical protein